MLQKSVQKGHLFLRHINSYSVTNFWNSVPLAIHNLLEILSFQVNLCVVQLLVYCSIVKMMTISVQLQTTFMNLHRVWFVWTGCLCMERSWWVFKRYAYMFCTVSAPTKTYKSNSTVTFWLWAKVPCCWHHPWHPGSWGTVRGMWFLGQGSFNLTMPLRIYLWIAICFTGHVPQWLRQALKTPVLSLLPICSWLLPDL